MKKSRAVANVSCFTFHFSLLLMLSLLLQGCEGDSSISRVDKCNFIFSYQHHPTSLLFAAVQTPGSYVFVSTKGDGKNVVRHVYVQSNDKDATVEDNTITTALENSYLYMLGANNEIGLIIGCTNFNGSVAYDRTCPNCEMLRAMQWTGNRQQVVCNYCHRIYDLETGGIIEGDKGSTLRRYYCAFNGAILKAWN